MGGGCGLGRAIDMGLQDVRSIAECRCRSSDIGMFGVMVVTDSELLHPATASARRGAATK